MNRYSIQIHEFIARFEELLSKHKFIAHFWCDRKVFPKSYENYFTFIYMKFEFKIQCLFASFEFKIDFLCFAPIFMHFIDDKSRALNHMVSELEIGFSLIEYKQNNSVFIIGRDFELKNSGTVEQTSTYFCLKCALQVFVSLCALKIMTIQVWKG